jgi:hypothetical protein
MAIARGGDLPAARAIGERLRAHVRFEERELFPACEAALSDEVLEEVARRAVVSPPGGQRVRAWPPVRTSCIVQARTRIRRPVAAVTGCIHET